MDAVDPAVNPFATARIRPGALAFHFTDPALDAATLVHRFVTECDGRAAIVGPHGTGKSTLLAALRAPLEQHYGVVAWHALRREGPRPNVMPSHDTRLVVIDGYEQLALWRAIQLRVRTARRGVALLVTSHRPPRGLPVLWRTQIDADLIRALLAELLIDEPVALRTEFESLALDKFSALHGNLRETWFALYDAYESRRSLAPVRRGEPNQKPSGSLPRSSAGRAGEGA